MVEAEGVFYVEENSSPATSLWNRIGYVLPKYSGAMGIG